VSIEVDLSEVAAVVELLKNAPEQAAAAAHGAGADVGEKIKRGAMASAPADRPWLGRAGYRKKSWRDRRGSHTDVFSVADDRGRNVGFYVEHGTTDTPPVPVLGNQLAANASEFEAEIVRRVDPIKE
jgi:hypothetical protein